jgi:hypothetical protein
MRDLHQIIGEWFMPRRVCIARACAAPYAAKQNPIDRHCEERSDEAIQFLS